MPYLKEPQHIDWRMVFMLPPKRRFTAGELLRAQADGMSRTVKLSLLINLALPALTLLPTLGPRNPIGFSLVLVLFLVGLLASATAAWINPSSRAARWAYVGVPFAGALSSGLMLASPSFQREAVTVLLMVVSMGSMALCLGILHRHSHIEQRLREADERDKAIEMAQRLAGAQLEPHFLFNTLASAQHWVNTQDPRAAPLLAALTGYLRATLPMFKQPLMPVSAELLAVERYLQVMQARLGEARLRWAINVEDDLKTTQLPPGVLLTLVENAVAHGVEPQIAGGQISVEGQRRGDEVVFAVVDNGPGPALGKDTNKTDGVGLANARQRLLLTCGPQALLHLSRAPAGGCRAEVRLPRKAPT
jgi:signal transduction histidine kinase